MSGHAKCMQECVTKIFGLDSIQQITVLASETFLVHTAGDRHKGRKQPTCGFGETVIAILMFDM